MYVKEMKYRLKGRHRGCDSVVEKSNYYKKQLREFGSGRECVSQTNGVSLDEYESELERNLECRSCVKDKENEEREIGFI